MVSIPFPVSTSPGVRPQEGAGRLVNAFAEPRGEDLGPVIRRAPGASLFFETGESVFRGGLQISSTEILAAFESSIVKINYTGALQGIPLAPSGAEIGDMIGDGGLAAAFDGNADQATAACATKAGATEAWVGETLSEPARIFGVVVRGSNDNGYVSGANPDVTIELYGKVGAAPADAEDGFLLGSVTFSDTADESGNARTVTSNNAATAWDHRWIRITHDGVAATMSCAEVSFLGPANAIVTPIDTLNGSDRIDIFKNNAASPSVAIVCEDGAFVYDFAEGDLDSYPDGDVGSPACGCVHLGWFMFGYGNGDILASNLNSTDIDTTDSARTESNPDGVLRLLSIKGFLYALGEGSIEIWGDPINETGFPLSRLGYNVTPGLIGKNAIAGWEPEFGHPPIYVASDNTVRWLRGDNAEKISPPDLDRLIAGVADKSQIEALCYRAGGHAFWQVNGPDFSWVFAVNNLTWHERKSYLKSKSRLLRDMVAFGRILVGDSESGNLLEVSHDVHTEAGEPLILEVESKPVDDFPNRLRVRRADFEIATGVGISTGHDPTQTDPTVEISWSDDGGYKWTAPWFRKLGRQAKTGQRVTLNNCGVSGPLGRRWKLCVSDPVHVGLLGGEMQADARNG